MPSATMMPGRALKSPAKAPRKMTLRVGGKVVPVSNPRFVTDWLARSPHELTEQTNIERLAHELRKMASLTTGVDWTCAITYAQKLVGLSAWISNNTHVAFRFDGGSRIFSQSHSAEVEMGIAMMLGHWAVLVFGTRRDIANSQDIAPKVARALMMPDEDVSAIIKRHGESLGGAREIVYRFGLPINEAVKRVREVAALEQQLRTQTPARKRSKRKAAS